MQTGFLEDQSRIYKYTLKKSFGHQKTIIFRAKIIEPDSFD